MYLIKFFGLFVLFCICSLVMCPFVQMSCCSSRSKDPIIDLTSSPVSKQTRHSSEVSNNERFKSPLDSQTFSSIFQDVPTVVERIVKFDTLGSTFIPRIFVRLNLINHLVGFISCQICLYFSNQ